MNKYKKIFGIGLGLIALFLVAGATMAFNQAPAMAEENDMETDFMLQPSFDFAGQVRLVQESFKGRAFFTEALTEALGIPVDDLQAARQEALEVALDQAVAEGLISEERAEIMRARAALASTLEKDEILVQVLGIPVDDLQAAREEGQTIRELAAELDLDLTTLRQNLQAARQEVIQQAVADGTITQEQADLLADYPRPARPDRPGLRAMANRIFNEQGFNRARKIMDAALAEALGISVDELQAARQEALEATLEQVVEEGAIAEERAEIMMARAALAASLDPDAILAQVLGITTDELQAARDEGKTLAELVEELGLDPATVRENMAATREQVIQRAVDDGVITPEQAEMLQNGS